MSKRQYGRDLWDRMCRFVESPDGLVEYECGPWTIDKLYFLGNYLAITTHAMRDHPQFKSLNYIDLFCGAGVCAVAREGGRVNRFPGSALLAAGCEKPFHNLFLVDEDVARLDAVTKRISRLDVPSNVFTWNQDANSVVDELSNAIPNDSLNVAFIDPYSINIHFETIAKLATRRPLDLLILFADRMDIGRNVEEYYLREGQGEGRVRSSETPGFCLHLRCVPTLPQPLPGREGSPDDPNAIALDPHRVEFAS